MSQASNITLEEWIAYNRLQFSQGNYTPEDVERLALAVGFKQPEIDLWKAEQKRKVA